MLQLMATWSQPMNTWSLKNRHTATIKREHIMQNSLFHYFSPYICLSGVPPHPNISFKNYVARLGVACDRDFSQFGWSKGGVFPHSRSWCVCIRMYTNVYVSAYVNLCRAGGWDVVVFFSFLLLLTTVRYFVISIIPAVHWVQYLLPYNHRYGADCLFYELPSFHLGIK